MRRYVISFGDSDKYMVSYDGSISDFRKSDKLQSIKDRVDDYLKAQFPTDGYEEVVPLQVEESDGDLGYPNLDLVGIEELLKSVKRQVQIQREGFELNNNAPYDDVES